MLTKNFQDQFTQTNAIFRRDQSRDSQNKPLTNSQMPPTSPIKKEPPEFGLIDNTMPSYVKVPLNLNTNNNSDNRYLQPIGQLKPAVNNNKDTYNQSQFGYLLPTNKPFVNNNYKPASLNQSGYLQPEHPPTDDTYGGNYMNASIKQDTYMNEDFISELKNTRRPLIAEQEDDRVGDSYLIPRIGSNASKASSTVPLINNIDTKPARSSKNSYAPSPPPPTKLSTFRSNETDV